MTDLQDLAGKDSIDSDALIKILSVTIEVYCEIGISSRNRPLVFNTYTYSEENQHYLTCMDGFSQWSETSSMADQGPEMVASVLNEGWISRFGSPLRIIVEQGCQS